MDGLPKLVIEKYIQYMYEGDVEKKTTNPEIGVLSLDKQSMKGFLTIDENIRQFGNRKLTITAVRLLSRGEASGIAYAGQQVEINIIIHSHDEISNPIVGYNIKDRLGRRILGDNTALIRQDFPPFSRGQRYLISFKIDSWPNLKEGDYTLSIAIANGSLNDHEQCHYLNDAVIFKNIPVRMPVGIFSVLDTDVSLQPLT